MKCRSITNAGNRCTNSAVIKGMCMNHFHPYRSKVENNEYQEV